MAKYTRSNGANARSQDWDEYDEPQTRRTGTWLPLEALDDELFVGGPQLQPMPTRPRGVFAPAQPVVRTAAPNARGEVRNSPDARRRPLSTRLTAILAGAALSSLAVYVAVSSAVHWTQIKLDDLQYGRPRTVQLDSFVGHNEAEGVPSHFIAMNLNRRVTVMEFPGGDSTKITTIVGPYLFGEGEDLTPVQAGVQDVNEDGKPDLIVSVKNEQLIYLNDGAAFKLITTQEQSALQKSLAASNPATRSDQVQVQEAGK